MQLDTRSRAITDSVAISGQLRLAGYDKTREADRESLFATNSGHSLLTSITVIINYLTLDGRQLHSRRLTLPCSIPPGQTRRLDFRSWDRQHSFYYSGSRAPQRTPATPYAVTIIPVALIFHD